MPGRPCGHLFDLWASSFPGLCEPGPNQSLMSSALSPEYGGASLNDSSLCVAGGFCPFGTSEPRVCPFGNYCPTGIAAAEPCPLGIPLGRPFSSGYGPSSRSGIHQLLNLVHHHEVGETISRKLLIKITTKRNPPKYPECFFWLDLA
jgi:hypothetical protein